MSGVPNTPTEPDVWEYEHHVDCVVCPVCAFTFDACHEDQGGGYSCPLCVEMRVREAVNNMRSEGAWVEARLIEEAIAG